MFYSPISGLTNTEAFYMDIMDNFNSHQIILTDLIKWYAMTYLANNNDSINNVIMVGTGSGASGGDSLYLNYQAVLNPELNHDKYQIIKLVLDTTILANQG